MSLPLSNPLLAAPPLSQPSVIQFFDFFLFDNAGQPQENFNLFFLWNVTGGSVDLVGGNTPGVLGGPPDEPGGRYVDLGGSTGDPGRFETRQSFTVTPGQVYNLSFEYRSTGGEMNIATVTIGDKTFTVSTASTEFVRFSQDFTFDTAQLVTIAFQGDEKDRDNSGVGIDGVLFGPVTSGPGVGGGTAGDDTLVGGQNADLIGGAAGNDDLSGREGGDVLMGDAGADRLRGESGDDLLSGGSGEDTLSGGEGDDVLEGGMGIDLADFSQAAGPITLRLTAVGAQNTGEGSDSLTMIEGAAGSASADQLFGDALDNRFFGNGGADILVGEAGADLLNGGAADDQLFGGAGGDLLSGETGADQLFGGADGDVLYGVDGEDVLNGEAGSDILFGQGDADSLFGGAGDDVVFGGAAGDALFGQDGFDVLSGGDGGDLIVGGAGGDRLEGGAGGDAFLFAGTADGNDLIVDFQSGSDQLRFTGSAFGLAVGGVGGSTFVSGAQPQATGSGPQFLYNTTTGDLFFDADGAGAGAAVFLALLQGAPALTASDFLIV